ncbi:hypothetical protein [Rhodophyticola porphyridii]|uniref:GlsB/YeaQ/YmgE family stress response membrane protein n=1 Tax=Rhodophyticola porphyridii TaxID=1852017 RepID=A0A3L9YC93_9RHOB|nr:hypothetical protein [Rhodophyticola porphyridii]RMA43626.1 hypothetical protein D9R08_01445 [Rhodophyticola porphyridii]
MGFFAFFGSLMIGGLMGYLFERWGITHNGIIPSVLIALGAVIVVFMLRVMFHLSFGSPGVDAIIGSAAALVLIPTEWAHRRRNRRK